jgi:GNAT superfamily N-acetyltransferase
MRILHLDDSKGHGDFSPMFLRVSDFLSRIDVDGPARIDYPWGRWEWMFSLPYLDGTHLSDVGVWEEDGEIVGLVTHESDFGHAYWVVDPRFDFLKRDMCRYARERFAVDGKVLLLIPDTDRTMQQHAAGLGFRATHEREEMAAIDLDSQLVSDPPSGYGLVSLADRFDLGAYHRVLWRGFNHPGEPPLLTGRELEDRRISVSAPHVALDRNIAVVAPDGGFVSYCGTWYRPGTSVALVEPVATDPDHRRKGLGRAAIYEALRRCRDAGARHAIVGSGQEFYYRIGFAPFMTSSWWAFNDSSRTTTATEGSCS